MFSVLKYVLVDYWDQTCDPRTVNYWIMSHGPTKFTLILFLYIGGVFGLKRIMKKREPIEFRILMLIHNVFTILINIYFLVDALVYLDFGFRLLDFRFPSHHDQSAKTMHIIRMFHAYQWIKFIDFFDTFFLVLKKKKLTVLHIYHHVSVPIIGWISSWVSSFLLK